MQNKKILLVSIVSVLLIGGGIYFIYSAGNNTYAPVTEEDGINYNPPTEEETQETEENKEDVAKRQELEDKASKKQATSTSKKQVEPVISSWGQNPDNNNLKISSFVSEVYENGGTCTLTLEKSGKKVTRSQTARKDAQVTTCGTITISRSSLSAGTWKATIAYSSNTAGGASQMENIPVK